MDERMNFDEVPFINSIKDHPPLWDGAYGYTDAMKAKLWRKVLEQLVPEFPSFTEEQKKEYERHARAIWYGLRMSFIDETKRRYGRKVKRLHPNNKCTFRHYDLMKFIYPCLSRDEFIYCHQGQRIPARYAARENAHITNRPANYIEMVHDFFHTREAARKFLNTELETAEEALEDLFTIITALTPRGQSAPVRREDPSRLMKEFMKEYKRTAQNNEE